MKNVIKIFQPVISERTIKYVYEISGEWSEAFNLSENFFIEYSCNISNIPFGIAVIPFLCNILPIAWVYDADVYLEVCDKTFLESIPEFKKGYEDMYPMLEFKGNIHAENIEDNSQKDNKGAVSFFSGGVDAFNTLVNHIDEKPTLLTVWGADITFEDEEGWKNVYNHIRQTASQFDVEFVTIKSAFRRFINPGILNKKVEASGDMWWHGFQHGIGIIAHAAPVCYVKKKKTVYFASSFTAADKGKITCASDPTIDNFVKFAGSCVVHDGYEFSRQDKVHNIVEFSNKNGIKVPLRVCWKSTGGKNCCQCEKCWRTILELIAEGASAENYDLNYNYKQLKSFHKLFYDKKNIPEYRKSSVYSEIQKTMRKNLNYNNLPAELKWFYKTDIRKLGYHPYRHFFGKCKSKVKKLIG